MKLECLACDNRAKSPCRIGMCVGGGLKWDNIEKTLQLHLLGDSEHYGWGGPKKFKKCIFLEHSMLHEW